MARIRRDDSLGRITKITKTLGIGLLAMTGALGLYLSKALPGHSSTSQSMSTSSSATNTTTAGSSTSGTSSGSGQLSPPSSPPAQSQQPAPVVSGAS
jgi:hypothetical protein